MPVWESHPRVHLTFQLDQWRRWIGHSEPISNCKFNQRMTPIKAAAPYVVSLLEQVNKALGTWQVANDLLLFFNASEEQLLEITV